MTVAVTAAFPFVPATINLAHVASTYLPADLYCRFSRLLGDDAILVSGIDVHSSQVSRDGRTRDGAAALCDAHEADYRRDLARLHIGFDVFERTDHPAHAGLVARTLERLRDDGRVVDRVIEVLRCGGCGAAPSRRALRQAAAVSKTGKERYHLDDHSLTCPYCGSTRIAPAPSRHWFLPLEPHRPRLVALCDGIVEDASARAWLRRTLAEPLADWDISRDQTIGIPIPFDRDDKSLYLWFESLIGYTSLASMTGKSPSAYVHFLGKNILYYHGVIWPILLEAGLGGDASAVRCAPRGFLNLQSSELVDIERALALAPADYLRFYLATRVPDSQVDFVLTVEELRRVCNGILCRKAGNLLRRLAVPLSQARGPRRIDGNDPVVSRFRDVTLPALRAQLLRLRVRGAVNEVTAWVHHVNAVLEERRLFAASPESDGLRAFLLAATLTLLEPVVPGLVRDYPAFAGWTPGAPIEAALECPVPQPGTLWREI